MDTKAQVSQAAAAAAAEVSKEAAQVSAKAAGVAAEAESQSIKDQAAEKLADAKAQAADLAAKAQDMVNQVTYSILYKINEHKNDPDSPLNKVKGKASDVLDSLGDKLHEWADKLD